MSKNKTFIDSPEWSRIVDNIKGVMMSDSVMETLMDFERVLDEADIYAFKNWGLGELVDGPIIKRYDVQCTFMWPKKMMPDPKGAKRLLPLGCDVGFKQTTIKVPVKVDSPNDFKPGTHYPKLIDRDVWLVRISVPKQLMEDVREGSVDIADQTIDTEDLDDAYAKDYDTADTQSADQKQQAQQQMQSQLGQGMPPGI